MLTPSGGMRNCSSKSLNGRRFVWQGATQFGPQRDPAKTQGTGKSAPVGQRGRVYVGERAIDPLPPIVDPTLDVQSFRDLAKTCR
jgi:hypothetical protein